MKQKKLDDCRRAGFHDVGRRDAATRAGDPVHLRQAWRDLVANGMGSIDEAGRQRIAMAAAPAFESRCQSRWNSP